MRPEWYAKVDRKKCRFGPRMLLCAAQQWWRMVAAVIRQEHRSVGPYIVIKTYNVIIYLFYRTILEMIEGVALVMLQQILINGLYFEFIYNDSIKSLEFISPLEVCLWSSGY
jgi:hypothetical protein